MLLLGGNVKIIRETEDCLKNWSSLAHLVLSFVGVRNEPLQSDDKFTAILSVSRQQAYINAGKLQMLV